MAPRRIALLAIVTLGLAAAGCATQAHAASNARWHSQAPVAGGGGGSASPTPRHTSSPSPSAKQSATPGTSATTSKPPATPTPPTGIATGHGPLGSISVTGNSTVALTFDDGPGPNTHQILDLLERYNIKATFCMIGRQVHSYPNEIKRMVADGDTLCNHTWDHDELLRTRSNDQIHDELEKTNDAIHAIVPDAPIQYFRNPAGNFGSNTIEIAQSMGMKSLYWSVDPSDWLKPGTQTIIDRVIAKTKAGSIVLSHDGGGDRSQTVAAYAVLIPNLKARLDLEPLPLT